MLHSAKLLKFVDCSLNEGCQVLKGSMLGLAIDGLLFE